ncbi:hypothetical protein J2X68_000760 [Streptomyces sp. 3330]|uniref:hypothetical protein n=1 Tax=Streptomyces sp. 3330 TaxID=2817755 RepID=UPI00285E76B4|nr:hypothetical protein [Streptomyces sp. 3330]MDR6974082.1 hypothetical protein [Streptomyces sp. 3330]
MEETTGLRSLARELLPALPRLVGEDAARVGQEIRQALTASGDEALRRVLASDDRLTAWLRQRPGGEGEYRALPSGYAMIPGRGPSSGVSGATLFTCLTPDCAAPETFVRGNLRQRVPYCGSCNRLLSRAPT